MKTLFCGWPLQLWLMKRIREEEEDGPHLCSIFWPENFWHLIINVGGDRFGAEVPTNPCASIQCPQKQSRLLFAARCYASAAYVVMRCLYVSVCHVRTFGTEIQQYTTAHTSPASIVLTMSSWTEMMAVSVEWLADWRDGKSCIETDSMSMWTLSLAAATRSTTFDKKLKLEFTSSGSSVGFFNRGRTTASFKFAGKIPSWNDA